MQAAPFSDVPISVNEHVLRALQLNKDHQVVVKTQIEQLEGKLVALDKLLAAAEEHDEDDFEPEVGGYISIPGSSAISAPITSKELTSEDSQFYADSQRRQRYIRFTGYHQMRAKELEDLAEAVRTENHRLYALREQRNGNAALVQRPPEEFLQLNGEGIDWERVASAMTSRHDGRTARECEIRWMGDQHPSINHAQWSQPEVSKCRDLVDAHRAEHGYGVTVDWVWVSNELKTNRTPLDCMRHGTIRKTHVWTPESDLALLEAIKIYGLNNWLLVARVVSPDATAQQCQNRYQRTLDPTLKRGPWSPAEDAKLHLAVSAYGNSWVDVAMMMEGRNNEQCRDRWNERLDPKINRDAWMEEEDTLLMDAVGELGEGKWKAVSEKMGNGRKDSACRARYETLKKGKTKARTSAGVGSSSRPPDGQGDKECETSETIRPTPRKRAPTKGKGKQSNRTPLPEGDSTWFGDNPAQLVSKRPRATPRKRGGPPRAMPRETFSATDGPGLEEEETT